MITAVALTHAQVKAHDIAEAHLAAAVLIALAVLYIVVKIARRKSRSKGQQRHRPSYDRY